MQIHILAVGRLRSGPEKTLVDDYVTRFERTGRAHGLGPVTWQEIDERKARTMADQGVALRAALPEGAFVCALDERGAEWSSRAFAQKLSGWADSGRRTMAFLIGGADGLSPDLRQTADARMSFGTMVWPHMLVRVMLTEQLYRAATILSGSPYHRD